MGRLVLLEALILLPLALTSLLICSGMLVPLALGVPGARVSRSFHATGESETCMSIRSSSGPDMRAA